jgi:uncharacterized spore protein YtfJ
MEESKLTMDRIADTSINPIQETLQQFLKAADVSAVYAEPVEHGETLIIPAAEVLSGVGFGMGYGGGESPRGEAGKGESGAGGGGGGGGRVLSRPVAVIISDQHGVRVEPVVDPTKMAIAFFTTLGFMAAMASRMGGRKPRIKA